MRRSRFHRRHRAVRRFAVAEAAAHARLDWCADCLIAAIVVVLHDEAPPARCMACGRAWDARAVQLVSEAYEVPAVRALAW